jgi:hypothetical protein
MKRNPIYDNAARAIRIRHSNYRFFGLSRHRPALNLNPIPALQPTIDREGDREVRLGNHSMPSGFTNPEEVAYFFE